MTTSVLGSATVSKWYGIMSKQEALVPSLAEERLWQISLMDEIVPFLRERASSAFRSG